MICASIGAPDSQSFGEFFSELLPLAIGLFIVTSSGGGPGTEGISPAKVGIANAVSRLKAKTIRFIVDLLTEDWAMQKLLHLSRIDQHLKLLASLDLAY